MPDSVGVIYDLGANAGNNLPYYLSRARKVVAVEANPLLVRRILHDFSLEIASGRLVVCGCVLAPYSSSSVPFYVHRRDSHLSCLVLPDGASHADYEVVYVPSISVVDLVRAEGEPMYMKVDLEGADSMVLEQLFHAEIYPCYLSVELQTIKPLALIYETNRYHSFQLMDARKFSVLPAPTLDSSLPFAHCFVFNEDTAGPFGADIPYPWMDRQQALRNLSIQGLGWRDLHARMQVPDQNARVWLEYYSILSLLGALARKVMRRPTGPGLRNSL